MNKTLMILVATTALTAAVGVPAWSTIRDATSDTQRPARAQDDASGQSRMLYASSEDDDDGYRRQNRRGSDDDDDNYRRSSDSDDDGYRGSDDDDDDYGGSANNPAPAGTVAPPQNGLFQNGTPPRVQLN
jgi:hypothetical protein